jgi:putative transcriptional regulator
MSFLTPNVLPDPQCPSPMSSLSQAVFAHYLHVSVDTVSKWEQGKKHPSGPALKLLNLVRRKGLEAVA